MVELKISSGDYIKLGLAKREVEGRVSGLCQPGESIRVIHATGGVTCETDNYEANTDADTKCSGTNTYLDGNGNCDSATTIVTKGFPEGALCGASPWGNPNHGHATDCQGTNPSSDNCPSGYSYKYIYMSSKAAFGTCVKN